MKHIFIPLCAITLLSSCAKDYDDWANPQHNAQEEAAPLQLQLSAAPQIDFKDITTDSVQVFIPSIESKTPFTCSYKVKLFNPSHTDSIIYTTDNKGKISTEDLKRAVERLYSKRPIERKMEAHITAMANHEGETFRLQGATTIATRLHQNSKGLIYLPKESNNWKEENTPFLYSENYDSIYTGYAYLKDKLSLNYSVKDALDTSIFKEMPKGFNIEGNKIKCKKTGFYFLKINLKAKTFEAIEQTWGIIGDATPHGWGDDTPMTYNEEQHCWTLTTRLEAKSLKFRANHDWGYNLGGTPQRLGANGSNIQITKAGDYTINLYLTRQDGNELLHATLELK